MISDNVFKQKDSIPSTNKNNWGEKRFNTFGTETLNYELKTKINCINLY